jgi:uncharacterized protein YehS (DUF1456 family)
MTNNDILRRLRFTFDFGDDKMIALFKAANYTVNRSQISDWLKKEEDPQYSELFDDQLCVFLDGMINTMRGKREGPQPPPLDYLSNNMVLRKIKIALNLGNEDMLEIIGLGGMKISKHELSAFFRNPKQNQYRPLKDQILRKFLFGLQKKYRKE